MESAVNARTGRKCGRRSSQGQINKDLFSKWQYLEAESMSSMFKSSTTLEKLLNGFVPHLLHLHHGDATIAGSIAEGHPT
jgi:hypothetical protein